MTDKKKLIIAVKGGPGSGFRGHGGRIGKRGGSVSKANIGDMVSFVYSGDAKPVTLSGKITYSRSGLVGVDVGGGDVYNVRDSKITVTSKSTITQEQPTNVSRISSEYEEVSDSAMNEEFSDWADGLSEQEFDSIYDYMDTDFAQINSRLRHGGSASQKTLNDIENMDAALKRTGGMPKDAIVYRGLGSSARQKHFEHLRPGDEIRDRGFVSTTLSKDLATDLAGGKGVVLRIATKRGCPGAYISGLSPGEDEMEFLFASDSIFSVLGTSIVDGQLLLDMEYADHGSGSKSVKEQKKPSRSRKFVWDAEDIEIIWSK